MPIELCVILLIVLFFGCFMFLSNDYFITSLVLGILFLSTIVWMCVAGYKSHKEVSSIECAIVDVVNPTTGSITQFAFSDGDDPVNIQKQFNIIATKDYVVHKHILEPWSMGIYFECGPHYTLDLNKEKK